MIGLTILALFGVLIAASLVQELFAFILEEIPAILLLLRSSCPPFLLTWMAVCHYLLQFFLFVSFLLVSCTVCTSIFE